MTLRGGDALSPDAVLKLKGEARVFLVSGLGSEDKVKGPTVVQVWFGEVETRVLYIDWVGGV